MTMHDGVNHPDPPTPDTAVAGNGQVIYLDPENGAAVRFLVEMYAGTERDGWLTGVVLGDGPALTYWAPVDDPASLVRQLAPHIGHAGVYFGVATRAERLPNGRRGGDVDCLELPALWADIDIAGPGHKSDKQLAVDLGQALAVLGFGPDGKWRLTPHTFPLCPSIVVMTGGGIHPYWLTTEAMDAAHGTALNQRLHHHLSRLARDHHGFEFDRTCDAARILRLPGTQNVKQGMGQGGALVEVIWPDEADAPIRRYEQSELDDALEALPEFTGGPDDNTRRLSDVERSSDYFTGDSPFALWNRSITITEMCQALGLEFVEQYANGNVAWKRPGGASRLNFMYYADDDHLACYTDQHPTLRQHREYHPHSLLIDGFFKGKEREASDWLISQGYVVERARTKSADFEAFVDKLRARQANAEHAEAVAAAVADGQEAPRARLRGVDVFFGAQLGKVHSDKPLVELDRYDLPRLGFNSLNGHMAEIALRPQRKWVVRDLIIEGQHGVLSAGAKTGKTTTVADLAVAVGAGVPFLGIRPVVKTGPVLVLLGEGGVRPFLKRIQAICATRGVPAERIPQLPIYATERIPSVGDDLQLIAMAQAMADIEEHCGEPPAMVVLDPWYLAAGGDAELTNLYSMGALLDRAQRVAAQFDGTALMVVHHHNRNTSKSGVDRMSGAGPMEWGRFLIALDADPQRDRTLDPTTPNPTPEQARDIDRSLTDVTIIVSCSGGEIPARQWAYRRKMWTENPADAATSPDAAVLGYVTLPVPVDPEKDPDGVVDVAKGKGGRPKNPDPYNSNRTVLALMQHVYDTLLERLSDGELLSGNDIVNLLTVGSRAQRVEAINRLGSGGFLVNAGTLSRPKWRANPDKRFRSDRVDPSDMQLD